MMQKNIFISAPNTKMPFATVVGKVVSTYSYQNHTQNFQSRGSNGMSQVWMDTNPKRPKYFRIYSIGLIWQNIYQSCLKCAQECLLYQLRKISKSLSLKRQCRKKENNHSFPKNTKLPLKNMNLFVENGGQPQELSHPARAEKIKSQRKLQDIARKTKSSFSIKQHDELMDTY